MKPFVFSLEPVLIVRCREEQAAGEAWARGVRAETAARDALAGAKRDMEEAQCALASQRDGRFRPGDQVLAMNAIVAQRRRCEHLGIELAKAAQTTRALHAALLQARMKREVLTRLREKKMKEYQLALAALEAAAVDDLIIVRYGTRRCGI